MTFDAPTVFALFVELAGRAHAGQFAMPVEQILPSNRFPGQLPTFVEHPFVRMRPRGPAPWARISWWAVYRSPDKVRPVVATIDGLTGAQAVGQDVYPGVQRTFGLDQDGKPDKSDSVVVDVTDLLVAEGLMLLWIKQCFDLHDLRMAQASRPPQMVP